MLSTLLSYATPAPLVLVVVFVFVGAYLAMLCKSRGRNSPAADSPVKDTIFGLDFLYDIVLSRGPESNYLAWTCNRFRRYGKTYSMRSCVWETIFTSDSRNIKRMLAGGGGQGGGSFDDFQLPRLRVNAIVTLLGTGIFSVNGAAWAHTRAVLRPCLAQVTAGSGSGSGSGRDMHGSDSGLVEMLEGHFQRFLRHVPGRDGNKNRSSSGIREVVDLQPLFFALAMDIATKFLAGKSCEMLESDSSSSSGLAFFHDYAICSQEVIRRMCLGPLQVFCYNRAAQQAKKRVFAYVDNFIDEALGSQQKQQQQQEKKENQMDGEDNKDTGTTVLARLASLTSDRKVLRDQMLHLLVASRDTTAGLLSNLFFVLAKEPGMYARLRREVLAVCGEDTPPVPDQLKQMTYLRWCVQESLRLHPAIPTNAREATRDTTLPAGGGADGSEPLRVKKGALVVYNVFAMHRDEAVFGTDADVFRPERWAGEEGLRPGWAYLPFNGGPRICLGQKIALLEAHYLVARMVQTFASLTSRESREWEEIFGLAISCKHGVKVEVSWA